MNAAQNPLEKERRNLRACELKLTLDLFSAYYNGTRLNKSPLQ